jgi:predicted Zn finger-like uncharacterized protein
MILQCPSCNARFMVPDAMIPPEGRTVKCGKCAHQWFVDAPEPATPDFAALTQQAMDEPPTVELAPARHPVPAVKKRPLSLLPFKLAVPVLAIAWLVIALYAYFPNGQHRAGLSGIYSAFGVTNTQGLVFADVTMEREKIGERTKFILAGSIANHDAQPRVVPAVRVQLKDSDNEIVWERDYEVNQEVKAGEVYPFRIDNVETAFAERVTSIVLDLGNSFELVMR